MSEKKRFKFGERNLMFTKSLCEDWRSSAHGIHIRPVGFGWWSAWFYIDSDSYIDGAILRNPQAALTSLHSHMRKQARKINKLCGV